MNKKTALITGSSRGIGRAIAILFARNNYNVVINYNKSEKEAQELYDMLSKENLNVRIFKADVSNVQEANALVNYTIGQFENIDVLVNNAGIDISTLFDDKTKDNQTDQNETQKEQAADPGQADQTQENQPTDQIQENQPTTAENNQ